MGAAEGEYPHEVVPAAIGADLDGVADDLRPPVGELGELGCTGDGTPGRWKAGAESELHMHEASLFADRAVRHCLVPEMASDPQQLRLCVADVDA